MVTVDEIVARSAVFTAHSRAFVDVELAVQTLESVGAVAGVSAQVAAARRAVFARHRLALVDFRLTETTVVSNRTVAFVTGSNITTPSTVETQFVYCNTCNNVSHT